MWGDGQGSSRGAVRGSMVVAAETAYTEGKAGKEGLRMIGEDIRGIPEGRLTNHVAGSMEDCSKVGNESCRCCWIRMLLGIGWFDAAQSASSLPQSLVVYFSGVERRSGWDLVQSFVVPCGRSAVRC